MCYRNIQSSYILNIDSTIAVTWLQIFENILNTVKSYFCSHYGTWMFLETWMFLKTDLYFLASYLFSIKDRVLRLFLAACDQGVTFNISP